MDKESAVKRVKSYADLLKMNSIVRKVILYGSFAKGSARTDSDIDVAVIVKSIPEDFLSYATELFRLRRKIDPRIEPVLLEENENSVFLGEILKSGEVIYSAD